MTEKEQNIFISWFPLYYGLAFIKHILAVFYEGSIVVDKKIDISGLFQEEKEEVFNKKAQGFMFDKIYIICPSDEIYKQNTQSSLGWRKTTYFERDEIVSEDKVFVEIVKDVIKQELDIKQEIKYIENKYPEYLEKWKLLLWRNIQHYPPTQQVWWLYNISNLPLEYKRRFEFVFIDDRSFDFVFDYEKIAYLLWENVKKIFQKNKKSFYIVNISLAPTSFVVSWFSLAFAQVFRQKYKFLLCQDIKNSRPKNRFQKFFIKEIKPNLISDISTKISLYDKKPISKRREIEEKKFQTTLKQGFSILLLGERGIGKSYIAENNISKGELVAVNCASFIDSHTAEAELFGYKKGAFTGAYEEKKGLIEFADGKYLFMDEIHTLPQDVQFKLMRAFATDSENNMTIRRLGETKEKKIKLKALIFASNRTIDQLRDILLPDFFDRIVQLVIQMPPLRQTPNEIIPAFEHIWKQLKFDEFYDYHKVIDQQLLNWLRNLPLYGNFRDLQKIAINYKVYLDFPSELKKKLTEKSAFEYTKKQFEKFLSKNEPIDNKYFFEDKTTSQMLKIFKKDMANWAIKRFGSANKASQHFKKIGEKITKESLYNWRNEKI
jgi:transcriptional regulator with AAA-type ATPase domain